SRPACSPQSKLPNQRRRCALFAVTAGRNSADFAGLTGILLTRDSLPVNQEREFEMSSSRKTGDRVGLRILQLRPGTSVTEIEQREFGSKRVLFEECGFLPRKRG